MKTQQQQQAREMYFQTNMSKSEIADKLSVNRRTIYQWSVEGDWEKLRTSARSMPSILAEKCYYLIGHFTDHLLSRDSFYQSVTKTDADILAKLVNTVAKLKKGTTVSENMETFTLFLEGVQQKDPALADSLIPHVDSFVSGRSAASTIATLDGFTPQGVKPFPEKDILEKWQDEKDAEALAAEGWTPNVPNENRPQTQNTHHVEAQNFATPQPTGTTATADRSTTQYSPQAFSRDGQESKPQQTHMHPASPLSFSGEGPGVRLQQNNGQQAA